MAEARRCANPGCQGVHIVAFGRGGRYHVASPGQGNARWRTLVGIEIYDGRIRRGLAAELAALYPKREQWHARWGLVREPPAPPVEFWPVPAAFNEPLGPRRPPSSPANTF